MEKEMLREKLLRFKDITEELIMVVKNEQPDSIEGLFEQRQVIIDEIDAAGYDGDDFRNIAEQLQLVSICKTLEQTMYDKRDEMKNNLEKLRKRKTADLSYIHSSNTIKSFFSKKV